MLSFRKVVAFSFVFFACLHPCNALAHAKWFSDYDLSQAPRSLDAVFNYGFVCLYLVSILCIYVFFWVDRLLYRRKFLNKQLGSLIISQDMAYQIMRVCTATFFGTLFIMSWNNWYVYLTPELKTESTVARWLHLGIFISLCWHRIVPLAGVFIIILYLLAIGTYGVFHLFDYLIFPGIAVYFLLYGKKEPAWVTARYVVLFATTALTLLWGSIEKLAYPNWTYPILAENQFMLMGMPAEFYMTLAAFVEFNLTFVLLSSTSVVSRLVALAFNMIFILAVYMFGAIDLIGHLLIIAVLFILAFRGPTSARYFLVLSNKTLWTEAYFMTGLYILATNVIFIAYYSFYYTLIG